MLEIKVIDNGNVRIDKYLKENTEYSRSKIQKFIDNGNVLVNEVVVKASYIVRNGDVISINQEMDNEMEILPEDIKLDILYEDDNLLIINKPAFCHIHSDGNHNTENTLANMVASYYIRKKLDMPVRYIHRLDYDTTGIIIFAKDPLTMSALCHELEWHSLRRDYLAFVEGIVKDDIIIDKPIGRNRHNSQKYLVSKTGKKAITLCHPIGQYKNRSLVRLTLKTGRTHQIRVHMTSIGHPLLGDTLYGGNTKYIRRVALHSYFVSFINPVTKKKIELTAKLPRDMEQIKPK